VTAGVLRLTRSLLEPRNKGVKGEGLGERSASGRSRRSAGSGSGLSSGRGSSRSSSGSSSGGGSRSSGGRLGGGRAGAGGARVQSRAGDVVLDLSGVGVEDDTVLVSLVKAGTNNALRLVGSGASNFDVETLFSALVSAVGRQCRIFIPEGRPGRHWRIQRREAR
jgi:hypothetical protein